MKNTKLRIAFKWLIPFLFIPVLVILGAVIFPTKMYLIVSLGIAVLSIVLFWTGFEKKVIGSRRMVIVSIMTALCIVGRFIPFFKPVTAITIITAMYLGGESGFLVGALAAVLSNFYFGQGPWTPFQMLGWGMVGFIAGFLSKPLKKSKVFLLTFGVVSGVLFSFIMDIWTVMWYNGTFHISLYLSVMITAIPHTVVYSISNFIFLWVMEKPFGEKLERIRIKYGI